MQRLHELDLTGHVLARESSRWKHVSLPAVAPKDEPWEFPESKKVVNQKAGELLWPARLPQSFSTANASAWVAGPSTDNISRLPRHSMAASSSANGCASIVSCRKSLSSWSSHGTVLSSGGQDNDFVAGQVWARSGGKYFMLPYRTYERLDFGPTMAAIKACHAKFSPAHAVLIEDKANGPAIISELQKEIAGVVAVNPEGGKIARAQATAPLWEAGSIELPIRRFFGCGWIEDYLHNICAFPKAAHDDDMDATSQALIYMRSPPRRGHR